MSDKTIADRIKELEEEYLKTQEELNALKDKQLQILRTLLPMSSIALRAVITAKDKQIEELSKSLSQRSDNVA